MWIKPKLSPLHPSWQSQFGRSHTRPPPCGGEKRDAARDLQKWPEIIGADLSQHTSASCAKCSRTLDSHIFLGNVLFNTDTQWTGLGQGEDICLSNRENQHQDSSCSFLLKHPQSSQMVKKQQKEERYESGKAGTRGWWREIETYWNTHRCFAADIIKGTNSCSCVILSLKIK